MVTNLKQSKFLFSLFSLSFFWRLRCDTRKEARFSEIASFPTQWTSFMRFCLCLLWSVWPVIYLMILLQSAGVVGFAGKAPVLPEWMKQTKSHAQELAE